MNISIIGMGFVGLPLAVTLAKAGHKVLGVETNMERLEFLGKYEAPFYEPDLDIHMRFMKPRDGHTNLTFTGNINAIDSSVVFICVPEKYVEDVAVKIPKTNDPLIIVKSTVPPGTCDKIRQLTGLEVVSNPEFMSEGTALRDLETPSRIICGVTSDKIKAVMNSIYKDQQHKIQFMSPKSAELTKLASNSFLAMKVSYINWIASICERTGANVEEVALGMGLDPRIGSQFLKAGIGWGGSCFGKDLRATRDLAVELGLKHNLISDTLRINENRPYFFVSKIKKHFDGQYGSVLCVLGMSFKPNTNDLRESPALDVISRLDGFKVRTYDPAFTKPGLVQCSHTDPYMAATGANAIVLCTEWDEFQSLDWAKIKTLMRKPNIFDGRNFLNPEKMRSLGFTYFGVGK